MPNLSLIETVIIASRLFLKLIGFILIILLGSPLSWLALYFLAVLITEGLEFAVLYYSRKFPNFKSPYYLILSFLNSFLFLFFIYITNLLFTDFYIVAFLIVLASTIQGGLFPGFISTVATSSLYGLFLFLNAAQPVYYLRSLMFFVLWGLFFVLFRITSTAVKEKEAVLEKYQAEIDRLKNEFIAVASHNLLTPVASLKGYLSILTARKYSASKEKKFYLERAMLSTIRLEEIVNELISVVLLEKPEKVLFLTYVDFEHLLKLLIDDFKLQAEEKDINFHLFLPSKKLPKILLDPRRIRQAISNLLSNAIKFTDSGGSVELHVLKVGRRLKISVSDTGIGIPEKKIPQLFQKFYHARNYLETLSTEGTGLGLYITKLIVAAHGGKIEVQSKEGIGSTFTIFLPIKR